MFLAELWELPGPLSGEVLLASGGMYNPLAIKKGAMESQQNGGFNRHTYVENAYVKYVFEIRF